MNEINPYAPPGARVADVAAGEPASLAAGEAPFFAVSVLKFGLMSVCTFGIYELYWFYMNWKIIKARQRLDIMPFWRAFFGFFFCYPCFKAVEEFDHPAFASRSLGAAPLTAGWIVTSLLWRLPDPWWFASMLAFVFMIPVQRRVNEINAAVEPAHDRNSRLNWLNWIGVIVGGGMLILSVIGTFLVPEE